MLAMQSIHDLVQQFENETLPKEQWTHEAHLSVGCFYVYAYGKDEALNKIRVNIKKYNVATGGQNTETSGYHETITVFWIWNIHEFVKKQSTDKSIEQIIGQFISSVYSDKNYPLEFYTKEHLLSTAARLNFAVPDIKAFQ